MATKTISLDLEAYEHLRSARNDERESFSKGISLACAGGKRGCSPGNGGKSWDALWTTIFWTHWMLFRKRMK